MKKLVFIMPLMAISLLASCNNEKPLSLEECNWEKINEISKAGKASEWFNIGDTKTVKINGLDHKVRIIGFNQDKDKEGNKIGITFEFANLISDENGYSLATQWNDTNDFSVAVNGNYLNSTIRKALNGTGDASQFLWVERGAHIWSSTYKKTVLDMLPTDLVKVLKEPIKYVGCINSDGDWEDKAFNDKLFLLSPRELGYNDEGQESSNHTVTYNYYEGHTEQTDELRIKKQISGDYFEPRETIYITQGSGQLVPTEVTNHAGFNAHDIFGCITWLRSPFTKAPAFVWFVDGDGYVSSDMNSCFNDARPVAPAFCI